MRWSKFDKGQQIILERRKDQANIFNSILNKWEKNPGLYLQNSPDVNVGSLCKNKMLSNQVFECILSSTDQYGHPERAFFKHLKLLGLGRHLGLKFFEAFGVFSSALVRTQILIFANILGPTCSLVRHIYAYFISFYFFGVSRPLLDDL